MSSLEHVCRNFDAITQINLFSTKNWSYLHFKILNISFLKVNIHHNEIQSTTSLQPIFSYLFSPFTNCWSHQTFSSLYFYTLIYDNKSYPRIPSLKITGDLYSVHSLYSVHNFVFCPKPTLIIIQIYCTCTVNCC